MLVENGKELLQAYTDRSFEKKCVKISEQVYYFQGYGHSNATLIIGDRECILVDTLDSDARAERLKQEVATITEKPITTLIYTHGHPDHLGGSGAFEGEVREIIAHAPMRPVLEHTKVVSGVLMKRGARQFGVALTDEELITQGLGPREGKYRNDGDYHILPATTVYAENKIIEREIAGVKIQLIPAVGETDDQMYVWLPEQKVLCCGDNYYGCFPNLYALRGSQYRDVAEWVNSLNRILEYPVEVLLPGHTPAIIGKESVTATITTYRDALASVLHQTLNGMAEGKTIEELAATVKLPEELAKNPLLGEHYGSVEWSVRSIFTGYAGWFDGNPTNIHPLSPEKRAKEMLALAGGEEAVLAGIEKAWAEKNYQWAMELCDVLLNCGVQTEEAKKRKARCCFALAELETSSNGRHFYLTCAKELAGELTL